MRDVGLHRERRHDFHGIFLNHLEPSDAHRPRRIQNQNHIPFCLLVTLDFLLALVGVAVAQLPTLQTDRGRATALADGAAGHVAVSLLVPPVALLGAPGPRSPAGKLAVLITALHPTDPLDHGLAARHAAVQGGLLDGPRSGLHSTPARLGALGPGPELRHFAVHRARPHVALSCHLEYRALGISGRLCNHLPLQSLHPTIARSRAGASDPLGDLALLHLTFQGGIRLEDLFTKLHSSLDGILHPLHLGPASPNTLVHSALDLFVFLFLAVQRSGIYGRLGRSISQHCVEIVQPLTSIPHVHSLRSSDLLTILVRLGQTQPELIRSVPHIPLHSGHAVHQGIARRLVLSGSAL
mmetsp:Transcript_18227/g.40270  ORF Transcript_18227/g.40270 Transcript_18227/m.40270 type:complete len:353 (-) Transcript_18227:944-2002(-)